MFPIGSYMPGVQYTDGVYAGLDVVAVSGGGNELKVKVDKGLAKIGFKRIEQKAASDASNTAIDLLANTTSFIYVNHPDAKATYVDGVTGADIATFDKVCEGDHTNDNTLNGSVTQNKLKGRSLVLAKVVTSANAGTVTISGTWAADDTASTVIDGTTITVTAVDGVVANIATLLKNAINANTSVNGKVVATSNAGVVTITALTSGPASAYTFTASEATVGNGTAAASGSGNLAGAAVASIDNTTRFDPAQIPNALMTQKRQHA